MNRRSKRPTIATSNKAIEDKKFQEMLESDESLNFLLRDTISLTMLGGSGQTNVIPPEAWANLDVRILPGGDPKAVQAALQRVVNDPNVTVEALNREFQEANYSGTDNCAVCGDPRSVGEVLSGDAGGAAYHQWLHGESALPAAGD